MCGRAIQAAAGENAGRQGVTVEREKKHSGFRIVLDFLRRLLGRRPAAPGDPYANVTAPLRHGPKGRSGAAVAEIEDESFGSFPPRRRS